MPSRVDREVERRVLAAIDAGQTIAQIAVEVGVCVRTITTIKLRCRGRSPVGRQAIPVNLNVEQLALIETHMEFARRLACRLCVEKSHLPELERDDYISVAYIGLIKAASRWMKRGPFKSLARVCIRGAIRDYRRNEMRSNGWVLDTRGGKRVRVKLAERVGLVA